MLFANIETQLCLLGLTGKQNDPHCMGNVDRFGATTTQQGIFSEPHRDPQRPRPGNAPSDMLIEAPAVALCRQKDEPCRRPCRKTKVERILETARLVPRPAALQPYEIIVVTNKEVRERIKPIAWNQGQITDGSHLLVFAAWDNYTTRAINMMFDLTNTARPIERRLGELLQHAPGHVPPARRQEPPARCTPSLHPGEWRRHDGRHAFESGTARP